MKAYKTQEVCNKTGQDDFFSLPYAIYKSDTHWIAPQVNEQKRILDPRKNPYFRNASLKLYVCYSGTKPVSRAITVINRLHWDILKKKSAFFGFFESFDDENAANSLFRRMEDDSRKEGAHFLEGPFNPNHYSELGLLTGNFSEDPIFFETYNPEYYKVLLSRAGYNEFYRIHTRKNDNIIPVLNRKFPLIDPGSKNKDLSLRRFSLLHMRRDLDLMRDINNDAFSDNWYFMPLTREEYKFSSRYMFLITSPRLILFAEYKGKPVGVLHLVLNLNTLLKPLNGEMPIWRLPEILLKKKRIKEILIFTVGIKKDFRDKGISSLLIRKGAEILRGYRSVSTTWMSDTNRQAILMAGLFELKPYRYFTLYSKNIVNQNLECNGV